LAHPALVTLAQELAALGPALVPLIAEDDRFLTLEWHGGGLSQGMSRSMLQIRDERCSP
jgi:hypothetical protein